LCLLLFRLIHRNVKTVIEKTVIFLVVLYEYDNWSVTLREDQILNVFEDRVLRRTFDSNKHN
jgi:hypothetical protein